MAGGLLNLVAAGNQNVILNGNPQKTFFKTTYKKYSNFGIQKFRLDFDGLKELNLNTDSMFQFKVNRHAELLMDTYMVINMPDIWSPIKPPKQCIDHDDKWVPYEFRWIKNLGTRMIREITLTAGGTMLQRFTGEYLMAMVDRDFSGDKKKIYNHMTGNTEDMYAPDKWDKREGSYPNAINSDNVDGAEPSIRGKQLIIPLNFWFTLNSKQAFPLIAMQYNELYINITLRPIRELFTIRDVNDATNEYPIIAPNFTISEHGFYRFIQTPPSITKETVNSVTENKLVYNDKNTRWNADIHLIANYCFLTDEEARIFAAEEQEYLIKEMHEHNQPGITGSRKIRLESTGLVSSYMFLFQRSDVNLRNEWCNYTNWPYELLPNGLNFAYLNECNLYNEEPADGAGNIIDLYVTGNYKITNHKDILLNMGIVCDGDWRENVWTQGVYKYIDKYNRISGNGTDIDGLYCYNFCLNTNPFDLQPNGAMNMSKINKTEIQFTTFSPPLDPEAKFQTICDPATGVPIGVVKPTWRLFDYNFDVRVYEERYNKVIFMGGNVALMNAR